MLTYYFSDIAFQSCPSRIFAFSKFPADTSSMADVKDSTVANTAIPAESASLCADAFQRAKEPTTSPSRSSTTEYSHRDRKISAGDMGRVVPP